MASDLIFIFLGALIGAFLLPIILAEKLPNTSECVAEHNVYRCELIVVPVEGEK